ncbi:HERV-H LTR-associating protein 1 [Spea bombifrons]|uniref:HERV-H LTR-associating protein 1 n=1 Tax=Spea bombifrons TaxID=233779 RepID=UPI002349D06E|nr:HERV-H LTR-associating protein 1 [Spea bombifrons]
MSDMEVGGVRKIPAASVDLSQFNFTDLVNGMLSKALKGAKKFFSFLSVTSYSSMAFHKVSIFIYNISNIKYVDYQKFPMRYCYCLNNRTNDLTDYTVLLLDIVGNTTSSLKELFKSTSIVSVSQSNESDCIYFCVMTGRTGRNLSDLWDLTQKPPIINFTFPKNDSSYLALTTDHKTVGKPNGISSSQQPTRSQPAISRTQTDRSFSRISSPSEEHIPPGGSEALRASVFTVAKTTAPLNQISSTKLPVMQDSVAFDRQDLPTKRDPISQQTRGKMEEIPSSIIHTFLSSTGTVPRVKPLSIDGHKMAVYTYTQSRCLQAKAAPTSPSITLVFQKVNPCVMELCRFFHQCLCVSQQQYSRHKTQRHCTSYYTWYLRNATYICEKFKRNSHTRTLRQKCLVNICKSI